jgi:hypothetical protein
MEHYSERFRRNFADGDWLTTKEAQAVLAANRGKPVNVEYVSYIAKRENVRTMQIEDKHFYLYDDIKDIVVSHKPGPAQSPSVSASAIRQREFRARRQAEKERQRGQADAQAC